MRSGSPNSAADTACSMSTSKPSTWPVIGLRKPIGNVFWSTPAISRPRCTIRAMVEPSGICPGGGSGPLGRRLAVASHVVSGDFLAVGDAGAPAKPGGSGTVIVDELSTGCVGSVEPHPASTIASAVTTTAALTSTP